MAYGARLLNASGGTALDSNNPTLRQVGSGVTVSVADQRAAVTAAFNALPGNPNHRHLTRLLPEALSWSLTGDDKLFMPNYGLTLSAPITLAPPLGNYSTQYISIPNFPTPDQIGWSSYYQFVNKPIFSSIEFELEPTAPTAPFVPTGTVCLVNGERPYRLIAPAPTTSSYTSNYGMRTFGSDGTVLFDSRDEYLAVRYSFIVPIAVVDNILTNGGTYSVYLPEPMPDCWVSIPVLTAWSVIIISETYNGFINKLSTYFRHNFVSILQVAPDRLIVSRKQGATQHVVRDYGEPLPSYARPQTYVHDVIVFVARNP